jgi:REP element-mobilizing transposase RayT
MARGNRRAEIFLGDADRRQFLALLAKACKEHAWRCLSYCLMGNHYHLVLATERPTLSDGMHFLNGAYARIFNAAHQRTGHLFESRYYPKLIADERYLLAAIAYVESNPVRAKLCGGAGDWAWNGYGVVVGWRTHGPWFDRRRVLSLFAADERPAIQRYVDLIADLDPTDGDPPWHPGAHRQRRRNAILAAHVAGKTASQIACEQQVSLRTVQRTLQHM